MAQEREVGGGGGFGRENGGPTNGVAVGQSHFGLSRGDSVSGYGWRVDRLLGLRYFGWSCQKIV